MWFGNAIIGEDGNTVLQTDLTEEGKSLLLFCILSDFIAPIKVMYEVILK